MNATHTKKIKQLIPMLHVHIIPFNPPFIPHPDTDKMFFLNSFIINGCPTPGFEPGPAGF